MHLPVRAGVLLLAAALLLSGCDAPSQPAGEEIRISSVPGVAVDRTRFPDPDVSVAGMVDGLPGDGLTGYVEQSVAWQSCGSLECAEVLAPLDYADPSSRAVTLSLARKRATKTPRLGTLFVNPGGPGGSGKSLVPSFDTKGLEQYDIVGWDPRGTGDSTPVQCLDAAQTDALNNLDASPDTEAERTALIEGSYEFAKSCWEHSGVLLEHISTIDTVRDLDLLRQLVGDDELHYLGYSYGTQIGATYAELFPQNAGRLVLDAAVNITEDDDVIQAMGFDLALGNFASWCAAQGCSLGGTKQEVLGAVTGLWEDLDRTPIRARDRTLTQSLAVTGVAAMLYGGKDAWPTLVSMIEAAQKGNGIGLMLAADSLNSRADDGTYGSLFYSLPAISCLDSDDDKGVLDADAVWQEDQQKAPIFGKYFGPGYTCALWPVRPSRQLQIRGVGAKPIVVIGGTGDNATPYQQAVDMAGQLDSGVLVTYDGEGHGSYGGKSACVDKIVVDYLVDGKVPKDGVRCS
ncbi:MAG: alpha/beta fold hydrolase [Propionibacteriaceae bacterium]|nr:alpha/beta fold hydrolase [Propionibacteriaceae bacterium]